MFLGKHPKKIIAGLALAALVMLLQVSPVTAREPVASLKGKKIVHFGIVVKDIEKSAKRLSEIFGVKSWVYLDLTTDMFENIVIHDTFLSG